MDNAAPDFAVAPGRRLAEPAGLGRLRLLPLADLLALPAPPALVAAVLVLGLIAFQLIVHQDEGGWVAKSNWPVTTTLDGHLVAWEWVHVGETVAVVDGDRPAPREIGSQNAFRFAGGYLLALFREPLDQFYAGAVAAHIVAWVATAWALYLLGSMAGGSPRAGVVAAVLVATGPGFIGYLGQVDAHPFGYAAVALYPALVERLQVFGPSPGGAGRWLRPLVAGLTLSVAAFTIEVGLPLLLFLWLFYGLDGAGQGVIGGARRGAQLGVLTVAFLLPYLGFQGLVGGLLFERVAAHNHPLALLQTSLASLPDAGLPQWVMERGRPIWRRWTAGFPVVVSVLAVIGAAVVPRRWLLWAATFVLAFGAAIALTKPATREVYLLFPPLYMLAACGADRAGTALAGALAAAAHPLRRLWLRRLVLAGLLAAVFGVTNADLLGDYSIPDRWFHCGQGAC